MPAKKIFNVSTEDIRLCIELLKERDRLYAEADRLAEIVNETERRMVNLRRQARALSCQDIAQKLDLNKDIVFRISKRTYMPDEIEIIDPEYFFSKS